MTKRCKGGKKALPTNYQRDDELFMDLDERERKAEEISQLMKDSGMSASLKSRDDLLDEYADALSETEDDDMDDDMDAPQKPLSPPGFAKSSSSLEL
jgi:hypothetical protein